MNLSFSNNNIDNPEISDNRNYDYSLYSQGIRDEYSIIVKFVNPNSSVIDLGCGDGELLSLLVKEKNVAAAGVELSSTGVKKCLDKNLDVIQGRIDQPLPFKEKEFDYSICNVTLQMVNYPEILLSEMKRISNYLIVSFPNFAFFKNRFELFFNGTMPKTMLYGYSWYNTGHIHQLSIADFYFLLNKIGGLKVISSEFIPNPGGIKTFLMKSFPNLFQQIPIFLIKAE